MDILWELNEAERAAIAEEVAVIVQAIYEDEDDYDGDGVLETTERILFNLDFLPGILATFFETPLPGKELWSILFLNQRGDVLQPDGTWERNKDFYREA